MKVAQHPERCFRITPKRKDHLQKILAGTVRQAKFGYGSWRIISKDTHAIVHPTVVGQLMAQNLAKWVRDGEEYRAELTEAGIRVLNSN